MAHDLIAIIRDNLPEGTAGKHMDIAPEHDLRADLGADELAIHGIALDLGNALGRDVPERVSDGWQSFGDIAKSMEAVA